MEPQLDEIDFPTDRSEDLKFALGNLWDRWISDSQSGDPRARQLWNASQSEGTLFLTELRRQILWAADSGEGSIRDWIELWAGILPPEITISLDVDSVGIDSCLNCRHLVEYREPDTWLGAGESGWYCGTETDLDWDALFTEYDEESSEIAVAAARNCQKYQKYQLGEDK